MDPLTQAGLGATVGAAFFHRTLGRKAIFLGALLGMSPDLDMVVSLWSDEWDSLKAHRGASHSLLVLPWVSIPLGWALSKIVDGGHHIRSWILLSLWALCTHPMLDTFTTYGTQLLAPFSRKRFVIDAVAIIDPLFTLPLLIAMFLVYTRWGSDERVQRWGRLALLWCCAYLAFGWVLTLGAEQAAREQLAQEGFQFREVRGATPMFFPLIRRVSTVDDQGEFRNGFRSSLAPAPIQWNRYHNQPDPRLETILDSKGGRTFHWFADGFVQTLSYEDQVVLVDRRYGWLSGPDQTPFLAVARFDDNGELIDVTQKSGMNREQLSLRRELELGWRLLWGD